MKILHVINNLEIGGAEKLLLETLPIYNRSQRTDLALLNGKDTPFLMKLREHAVQIFALSGTSLYNPVLLIKLMRIIPQYDLIHVHLFPAQYWVVLAKLLTGSKVKLIFSEHSTYNKRLYKRGFRWIERFVYSYYSKIVCISPDVVAALNSQLHLSLEQTLVVYNGVNVNEIEGSSSAQRSDFGLSTTDTLIGMTARFSDEKDHYTVLRSMEYLPDRYRLLLIGDGPRRSRYEAFVKQKGLDHRVLFLGIRSDVYSLLKMVDIVVQSSHHEGFGLAAVEGMAAGKPVIASDVPGLGDVVRGAGLLFTPKDAEDLSRKIAMLEDAELYEKLRSAGKQRARAYDIHKQVEQITSIYKHVLQKK